MSLWPTGAARKTGTFKEFGLAGHQLTAEQVQDHLLYLMAERSRQWNTVPILLNGPVARGGIDTFRAARKADQRTR